jgi:hypothetical protein
MKTIITTYPGYQELPAGIKRMLVASEDFFFREAQSASAKAKVKAAHSPMQTPFRGRFNRPGGDPWMFGPSWRN